MRLTDTHCHLNLNTFLEDLPGFLERAAQAGVARVLVPGIDLQTSRVAVELAEQHSMLYAAVGVHPGDAATWNANTLSELCDLARHPKAAAIGEIGLDYYRDRSPRPLQREVFEAQLQLAGELGLPVVVHNRDSFSDLWNMLEDWQAGLAKIGSPLAERPGVLHSFDGTLTDAQRAVEKHFAIGISGPVTFKNARERQETAAGLPLESILIESDAPYLTPQPFRGRWPNEPAYVRFVAEKIAELHQISVEAAAQITWDNAAQLFHWRTNS